MNKNSTLNIAMIELLCRMLNTKKQILNDIDITDSNSKVIFNYVLQDFSDIVALHNYIKESYDIDPETDEKISSNIVDFANIVKQKIEDIVIFNETQLSALKTKSVFSISSLNEIISILTKENSKQNYN